MAAWIEPHLRWAKRAIFSAVPGECWLPARDHPAYHQLEDRYHELGRPVPDEDGITYRLTQNLVADVVFAARAVVETADHVGAIALDTTAWARRHGLQPKGIPTRLGGLRAFEFVVEFSNLLMWGRALDERLQRRGTREPTLGLLPALDPNHPLGRQITTLADRLRQQALAGDLRHLANFVIHTGVIPYPWSSEAAITLDDRISFPMPGSISREIHLGADFTYEEGRDAVEYARHLRVAVVTFVEGTLAVLEDPAVNRIAH